MTGFAGQNTFDVVVIGAGPAGLACGYELQQRGFSLVILERGRGAGESWRQMPRTLHLISPWKANVLPGNPVARHRRHDQPSRAEFLAYLEEYTLHHQLPLRTETPVLEVRPEAAGGFGLVVPNETLHCRWVINATGYFLNPFQPKIPGALESSIPQMHVAQYRDPAQARGLMSSFSKPVLIIGKRLSAGQTLVELASAGVPVALSHRAPLEFGAGPASWWLLLRIFPWLEALQLRWGNAQRPTLVKMQGGPIKKLIRSGRVPIYPEVVRFEGSVAVFADDQRLEPSAVIYATGFRPVLRHLESLSLAIDPQTGLPSLRDLESTSVPGLFFLGLDQLRNFQSRFLRGIRRDAAYLAERLASFSSISGGKGRC